MNNNYETEMNYEDNYEIDYDLLEKKERAKKNLGWFLGVGIIGSIILLIAMGKDVFGSTYQASGLFATIFTVIFMFLVLLYCIGSIPMGVRLLFKVIIPCNIYTLGICVILGMAIGLVVTPIILIRDIYYLAKKY